MDERARTRLSKFLSLVLRHRPEAIGIRLDEAGWVDVDALLAQCEERGRSLTRAELEEVVAECPKQRFALSEDGARIRASQGHSVPVELGYEPAEPPELLFHGTTARFLPSIRDRGLVKKGRHHVHLSPDREAATAVGKRRGEPVVLEVLARDLAEDGHEFFVSANGVWLTDSVPPAFIRFPA